MKSVITLLMMACVAVSIRATEAFVYQGALSKASGEALEEHQRTVKMTFSLYTQAVASSDETCLWRETHDRVTCDVEGNFLVALGEGVNVSSGDSAELFAQVLEKATEALYLGIKVGDEAELTPRQSLLMVPVVSHAVAAQGSPGDFDVAGCATLTTLSVTELEAQTLTFPADETEEDSTTPEGSEAVATVAEEVALVAAATDTITTECFVTPGRLQVSGGATVNGSISAQYGVSAKAITGYGAAIKGMIVPWMPTSATDTPPAGWAFCDGKDGRPDLNSRFAMASNASGVTGGAETVTLTTEHLPKHEHSFSYNTAAKMHNFSYNEHDPTGGNYWVNWDEDDNGQLNGLSEDEKTKRRTEAHYTTYDTDYSGHSSPSAIENRPPFMAVYFIIYVGE